MRIIVLQYRISLLMTNIFYRSESILTSPSLSLRRKYCYGKEIVLLWRYCSLDRMYRHETVAEKQILFDSRITPYKHSLQAMLFFPFFHARGFWCASISLNLAKFPSELPGVIFLDDRSDVALSWLS